MKLSKEIKVAIISILVIITFLWLFYFLQGTNVLNSGRIFYVRYENVDGLLPTKPVNLDGLRIGQVKKINIHEKENDIYFIVTLEINNKIKFSKNTLAEIYEPGFLQGKVIQLVPKFDGTIAKNGDTLIGSSKKSLVSTLTNRLGPTQQKIDSLLRSFNGTLTNINGMTGETTQRSLEDVLKDLDTSIQSINKTANAITQMAKSADALVKSTHHTLGTVSSNLNKTVITADSTLTSFGKVAKQMNKSDIKGTLNNLNAVSLALKQTLEKVNKSEGTLNKFIQDPQLYDNLNATSKNLKLLIEDLKENPSKYIQFSVFGKKAKK